MTKTTETRSIPTVFEQMRSISIASRRRRTPARCKPKRVSGERAARPFHDHLRPVFTGGGFITTLWDPGIAGRAVLASDAGDVTDSPDRKSHGTALLGTQSSIPGDQTDPLFERRPSW